MHLTLVPIVGGSHEIKTKRRSTRSRSCARSASSPTCCCALPGDAPDEQRRKIALFTNVEERAGDFGSRRR